jgi:hypothetical protein
MGTAYDGEHINPKMSAPITNPTLTVCILPVMRPPLLNDDHHEFADPRRSACEGCMSTIALAVFPGAEK